MSSPIGGYGDALRSLKEGCRVRRAGWNGKGMWLVRVAETDWDIRQSPQLLCVSLAKATPAPWIGMKTADNKFVPWLCSQTDAEAEDWEVLEFEET